MPVATGALAADTSGKALGLRITGIKSMRRVPFGPYLQLTQVAAPEPQWTLAKADDGGSCQKEKSSSVSVELLRCRIFGAGLKAQQCTE